MSKSTFLFIFIVPFLILGTRCADVINTCLDVHGKPVDWYIIFLLPLSSYTETYKLMKPNLINYGYFDNNSDKIEYFELDNQTFPPLRMISEIGINGKSRKILKDKNYFFWNDDMTTENQSKSASNGKAHSKGALIYDHHSGVFLHHSLPRLPYRKEDGTFKNQLPNNAGIYGQHFLCMSINKENSLKIVKTLDLINIPIILQNGPKDNVDNNNEDVMNLLDGKFNSKAPNSLITEVETKKGFKFRIFSKNRNFQNIPYDTEIPRYYKDGFFVETWSKPSRINNICKGEYQIINVDKVNFDNYYLFEKGSEHSKWAVSVNRDVVCFGDLNRGETQRKRGGNVICSEHKNMSKILRKSIIKFDKCEESNKDKSESGGPVGIIKKIINFFYSLFN
jgi:hypothetical protein